MPYLRKQTISAYLRSECQRRLRLDLSPENKQYQHERTAQGMPPRQVGRPGIQLLREAGDDWEEAKLDDLAQTFGTADLVGKGKQVGSHMQYQPVPLSSVLPAATPGQFIVQAEYAVGATFENALSIASYRSSLQLDYADLRPDLIQLLDPGTCERAVLPDGSFTRVQLGDERVPLRIIDIKLTAEPSVAYLAEITYYAMTLAGWLVDNKLDQKFFVVPEAAVWPGSHDASTLVRLLRERQAQGAQPTRAELLDALDEDLEEVIFEVFSPRLRRFLQEELPFVLSKPWKTLEWHVDNRCSGCDYLAFPWPKVQPHPDHCWSNAQNIDHLSRVPFVSRGARSALEDQKITTVASLAATQPSHGVYDSHHVLRATRTVVPGRAQSLGSGQPHIPAQSGTSAIMPRWADLRVYLTADFDIGSGITIAFGFKAFWIEPFNASGAPRQTYGWQAQCLPVAQRDLNFERRELLAFLGRIHDAFADAEQRSSGSTVQVYIWDSLTYEHLVRVVGRHLDAVLKDNTLNYLAWLFPPEDILPNPTLATRRSPITIVREVVRCIVAAPVPHYYSLLNVARSYHSVRTTAPWNQFQVPLYFEDPLSDQIPSERAHEIWTQATVPIHWSQRLNQLERTVKTKLSAVESVTQRLGDDLGPTLGQTAPRIADVRAPVLSQRMSADGRLWFTFAKLNAALESLEVHQIRAMPPHEREARFHSGRLPTRLSGQREAQVLAKFGLAPRAGRWGYDLAAGSRELRARENDFNFALAPEVTGGFLDDALSRVRGNVAVPTPAWASGYDRMEKVCSVTIRGLDRDAGEIVVDLSADWQPTVAALEAAGVVDFSRDVIVDPVHQDIFTKRLEEVLIAIGNPPVATTQPSAARVLGATRRPKATQHTPPADILWDAARVHGQRVSRPLAPVRMLLAANGLDLNQSQWIAWEQSLYHRLRLIWGPPGTGKSRTLRAILLGALIEAARQNHPLRVLLAGPTYESIDNVLLKETYAAITAAGPLQLPGVYVARLRSKARPVDAHVPSGIDVQVTGGNTGLTTVIQRLTSRTGITLVASTPHQVYRLLKEGSGTPLQPWFDLILIDEASQMDVATSTLAIAGLSEQGSVVVAGDPKQLPPIHQADAPLGLEHSVGPIFSFLTERHGLQTLVLEENYRSNYTIVEFAHAANYPTTLRAVSPALELDLTSPLPKGAAVPAGWPATLHWTPEWASILAPTQPVVCFVYPEGRSSQWNEFEADAVTALAWILSTTIGNQLRNEIDPGTGAVKPVPGGRYAAADFWAKGIGVVTPHRAQQALTVTKLQHLFQGAATPDQIRASVDTVERFQGQQRDVMIATFALGDPDAIRDEDEFLMSLNRFNVMASRARAKLVVLISQEVVNHLPHNMDVLRESALLKTYAETFCYKSRPMNLGHIDHGALRIVSGTFRWRA
jgi:hypothetical protein